MFSNTSLDFISAMEITDHRHYDQQYRKQNRDLRLQECFLKISYFARKINETETVTLGLCYDEVFLRK